MIAKQQEYKVKFTFEDPGPLSIPVIQIKDVSFGYSPDKLLFKNLELNIDLKSRIAIVGPNGVGKSTLINLIMGELEPLSGEVMSTSFPYIYIHTYTHTQQYTRFVYSFFVCIRLHINNVKMRAFLFDGSHNI
jgi:ATPase subunit of ABC transporter with duplicated ATPase domains